jgi:hypothetical protein
VLKKRYSLETKTIGIKKERVKEGQQHEMAGRRRMKER